MHDSLQTKSDPYHLLDTQVQEREHVHEEDVSEEVPAGTTPPREGWEPRGELVAPIDPNDEERTNTRISRAHVEEPRAMRPPASRFEREGFKDSRKCGKGNDVKLDRATRSYGSPADVIRKDQGRELRKAHSSF